MTYLKDLIPTRLRNLLLCDTNIHETDTQELKQPQGPSFLSLPTEILQLICNHLPLHSAVSLTITCRKMLLLLGNEALLSLGAQKHADEKKSFLSGLQRDLSDWQLCHPCSLLHPVDRQIETSFSFSDEFGDEAGPKCVQISRYIWVSDEYMLPFRYVQWVMNRHRKGILSADDLMTLSYDNNTPWDFCARTTITPQIFENALVMHIKSSIRLPRPNSLDVGSIKYKLPEVCPHITDLGLDYDKILTNALRCRLSHKTAASCVKCSSWYSCDTCQNWFSVDVRDLEPGFLSADVSVHLDVRKWLGPCETPFDPVWWRHCFLIEDTRRRLSE